MPCHPSPQHSGPQPRAVGRTKLLGHFQSIIRTQPTGCRQECLKTPHGLKIEVQVTRWAAGVCGFFSPFATMMDFSFLKEMHCVIETNIDRGDKKGCYDNRCNGMLFIKL